MESFEDFVFSRDFDPVEAFGNSNFSLMWPADMDDDEVQNKIQNRWLQVDEARDANYGWDKYNGSKAKKAMEAREASEAIEAKEVNEARRTAWEAN
jgi:hypothetical protein